VSVTPVADEAPNLAEASAPVRSSFHADSPNLDLVRATAVLCVFFAHLYEIATDHRSDLAWHFAQIGVLMFFVHTSRC
jgi:peptidoglycan/LPS O-acetylase OafA/YrhL